MKFQILPTKIGEIVRQSTTEDLVEYIITSQPEQNQLNIECVKLKDLQRNASAPDNVARQMFHINGLTVIADSLEKYIASWNNRVARPHSLKAYFIENLDDVRQYFKDLHVIYDNEFHPDDDFRDYTNVDNNSTFTPEEAEYLNMIMIQCFDICNKNDVEIYNIAGEVQIHKWREKGQWPDA
jgi:hypothetical protein